ncbi:MAG: hypothetical protein ABEI13_03375, partial [Candidatus Paceibacteria bacterium]
MIRKQTWSLVEKIKDIVSSTRLSNSPYVSKTYNQIVDWFSDTGVWTEYSDMRILLDPNEQVYEKIIEGEDPEPEVSIAINNFVSNGAIAFDIGCRYGVQTLQMRNRIGANGEVYSFDPYPQHCEFLKRT